MPFPAFTRSLRFRLSGMTTLVAFAIGGLALAAVYVVVLIGVRSLTMTQLVVTGTAVNLNGRVYLFADDFGERQLRTVESLVKELLLNQIAVSTLIALGVMFVLAVLVGWVVAGRALRPITTITETAAEIQATDLTRRIEVEGPDDEITTLAKTFNAMLDRIDVAFRGQREYLAATSHDLRTPLATIRTNVDVALSDEDADVERWRETGTVVARAAERMSAMLDDLLATARLQAGRVEMVEVDLLAVAEAVADELIKVAEERAVVLSAGGPSQFVRGDRSSLQRAVTNLADNAVRHAPPGSQVEIRSGAVDGWAYLAVLDRGPGVDPALVDGSTTSGGLGLSIVRDIVSSHRGSLRSIDRPDGGTVMVIWLPTESASHEIPTFPLDHL